MLEEGQVLPIAMTEIGVQLALGRPRVPRLDNPLTPPDVTHILGNRNVSTSINILVSASQGARARTPLLAITGQRVGRR